MTFSRSWLTRLVYTWGRWYGQRPCYAYEEGQRPPAKIPPPTPLPRMRALSCHAPTAMRAKGLSTTQRRSQVRRAHVQALRAST